MDEVKRTIGTRPKGGVFYLLAGMLLSALIMLIGFAVLGVWPFGDGTILKVDCLHQYLPFFTDFQRKIRSGDSLFYSFSGGLGYDFWSTYAYYLASPLNWLMALIPTSHVCDFMDFTIVLKVSACGGIFSWYLHRRNPSAPFLPVVFGTMYAMGNFYIGYNFNIMWLDSMAVAPLIMYGIERLVKRKGHGGYIYGLALFYGLWCNYYIGFMLCIFSCLYLVLCLVCASGETAPVGSADALPDASMHDVHAGNGRSKSRSSFKKTALDYGRILLVFAWYSILAGAMAAMVLLPAYRSLTASESMMSNNAPSHLKFYTDFLSMYMSHFINAKPITISDSQVGFNAYCGSIAPLLAVCYLFLGRIRLRERIAHALLTAFIFAGVTVNYFNYMWHGFHTQNGLPNRFVFLYALMLLLLGFDVLSRIRDFDVRGLLVAGIVTLGLTVATLLVKTPDENWVRGIFVVLPLIMTCIYLAILLILVGIRPRQKIISVILGVLMLLEAAGHGIFGMCENGRVTRSIYLKDQESYQTLMNRQGDDTFYRSEIDSQRMRNVTIFAGGHSTVLFNSTMSEAMTHFCDRIGMEARTNKNGYNGVTRLMNDVLGVKYVLATIGKGDRLYQFPQIDQDNNLKVYKNDEALSLGFVVDDDILEWDIDEGTPIGVQNEFARLATGIRDLYMLDRTVDAGDNEKVEVKVPEGKQVYLYLPERVSNFSLHTPEYNRDYATYNDHLYTMNSLADDNIGDFTCDLKSGQNAASINIYTCPDEKVRQVYEVLAESQLTDVKASGAKVSGNLSSKKDGILLITLPYDEDWTVLLDGEKVEPLCIGSALMGVDVTEGEHTLSMYFVPDGFRLGAIISLIGLVLMIASVAAALKRRKTAEPLSESGEHVWPLADLSPKTSAETELIIDEVGPDADASVGDMGVRTGDGAVTGVDDTGVESDNAADHEAGDGVITKKENAENGSATEKDEI